MLSSLFIGRLVENLKPGFNTRAVHQHVSETSEALLQVFSGLDERLRQLRESASDVNKIASGLFARWTPRDIPVEHTLSQLRPLVEEPQTGDSTRDGPPTMETSGIDPNFKYDSQLDLPEADHTQSRHDRRRPLSPDYSGSEAVPVIPTEWSLPNSRPWSPNMNLKQEPMHFSPRSRFQEVASSVPTHSTALPIIPVFEAMGTPSRRREAPLPSVQPPGSHGFQGLSPATHSTNHLPSPFAPARSSESTLSPKPMPVNIPGPSSYRPSHLLHPSAPWAPPIWCLRPPTITQGFQSLYFDDFDIFDDISAVLKENPSVPVTLKHRDIRAKEWSAYISVST